MKARSRWVMNWDEVAVFDKNATSMGIEEIELMRAAGDSLAQAASAMAESGDILFLCGPGNNGGDGFVASCSECLSGRTAVVASHQSSKSEASSAAREEAQNRQENAYPEPDPTPKCHVASTSTRSYDRRDSAAPCRGRPLRGRSGVSMTKPSCASVTPWGSNAQV